jgi:hypothetical protein
MANLQTPQVTNRVSVPFLPNSGPYSSATSDFRWVTALFTVPTGLATSDTYELVRLPTSCRVLGMFVKNESALGTTVTFDVGLYAPSNLRASASALGAPTSISGAMNVIFATGVAGASTRSVMTSIFSGSTAANCTRTLWEIAGLTAEPQQTIGPEYVVTLTMTSVSTPTVGNTMAFLLLVESS